MSQNQESIRQQLIGRFPKKLTIHRSERFWQQHFKELFGASKRMRYGTCPYMYFLYSQKKQQLNLVAIITKTGFNWICPDTPTLVLHRGIQQITEIIRKKNSVRSTFIVYSSIYLFSYRF
jgi:hypothetical protein